APAERKRVRDALPGSYERLFHESGPQHFLLPLRGEGPAVRLLSEPRLERAIGVVYMPHTERYSHYFRALLAGQFDAVLHWGLTLSEIGRGLNRPAVSVLNILRRAGGFEPRTRRRAARSLQAVEREEISRCLAAGVGVNEIARRLGRAASTVSREIRRNGGRQ